MKTIRFVIWVAVLMVCAKLNAQTQNGFVKTLGRPNQKGKALNGVLIRAIGEHNPVLSKDDGTFSILMVGKQKGDAYSLQEVQKKGYELNENGVIGRQFAFSDKVPLTIVMVSSLLLQEDKQRIENNAFKVAEKNYKAKLDLLEQQKAESAITEEQYRKELLDLQDKFEKYQLLIDGLAEHYAHVDYDELDDKEREINICIENGELERADSLIKTLFDPIDVLKRNKEALAQLNQQISEANAILDKANEDMAAVLRQQEKDAEYLYQLYTIAFSRFDNEKAGLYISTRAELDTTNINWQIDAGRFMSKYLSNNKNALFFFHRALRQTGIQYPQDSVQYANRLADIAYVYNSMGNYALSVQYNQDVLNILQRIQEETTSIATIYNNIGYDYFLQINYPEALVFLKKSLQMRINLLGAQNKFVAESYNNIGNVYYMQQEYEKALDCYSKGIDIHHNATDKDFLSMAVLYHNYALVLLELDELEEALKFNKLALDIRLKILGEIHPEVANSYNTNGSIYLAMEDDATAQDYFQKSLGILMRTLGKDHPDVGFSYNNIGNLYSNQGNHRMALIFFTKAMQVMQNRFGEHHPNTQAMLQAMDRTFQAIISENPSEQNWEQIYEGFKQTYNLK